MATSYGGAYQARNPAPRPGGYGNDRAAAPRPTLSVTDIRLAAPIPAELFGDIAKDKAAVIAEAGGGRKNKSTQLRKFYDELVMWHEKVHHERTPQAKADKYAEIAPFIKMMKAKVAYARGRDHVDECFEQLLAHLVSQIDGVDSLRHAKLFMEAFMGFYKAQEK
ncbi:type III-A CRISPR-associated protein Csm2 [Malikia spinosa]|uniref:type III-A CRISPR-associated protein Csm2 n=1 Tax=Malikia spinosa TaxID=86180 RepID=UPI003FA2F908